MSKSKPFGNYKFKGKLTYRVSCGCCGPIENEKYLLLKRAQLKEMRCEE